MKNIYCKIIQPLQGCFSCFRIKLRIACGAINVIPFQGTVKFILNDKLTLNKADKVLRKNVFPFVTELWKIKINVVKSYFNKRTFSKSQRSLFTLIKGAICDFQQKTKVITIKIKPFKLNFRIQKSRRDLITIAIGATYGL